MWHDICALKYVTWPLCVSCVRDVLAHIYVIVYTHTYLYVSVYVYVYMYASYVSVYVHVCMYALTYTYVGMHIYWCMNTWICMYASINVCDYIRVCMCVCVSLYIRVCLYVSPCVCVFESMLCVSECTCVYTATRGPHENGNQWRKSRRLSRNSSRHFVRISVFRISLIFDTIIHMRTSSGSFRHSYHCAYRRSCHMLFFWVDMQNMWHTCTNYQNEKLNTYVICNIGIYMSICVHKFVCHVCNHLKKSVHICIFVRIYWYFVRMCKYIVYIRVHVYTCLEAHTYICLYIYMYTFTRV